VGQRTEDEGEDETTHECRDQRRVVRHRYFVTLGPQSPAAGPTVHPSTTSEAIARMKMRLHTNSVAHGVELGAGHVEGRNSFDRDRRPDNNAHFG
jgi:hypothetical protein